MATPNTAIGLSDVNDELNYPATTARAFNDPVFRDLSGIQTRTVDKSGITINDVRGKAAFDGLIAPTSNSVATYGGVFSEALIVAATDMYSPNVVWDFEVITGSRDVRLDTVSDRAMNLRLFTNEVGTAVANVRVTATVSYRDHLIGTDTKYVNLAGTIYNPALVVSGPLVINSSGYVAQTAVTTLTATSNVVGGVIRFTVNPGQGASITGNTITFNAATNIPGNDNNQSYSLKTEVLFNGNVVATDTKTVNVRANFQVPDFVFAAPASSNNIFANNGPVNASLRVTADHNIAGANIVWTATKVSGDDATLTPSANLQSANLTLAVASGQFGTKKAVYDVFASLQYANGYVLNSKSTRLTLRTAAYGLTFNPASDQQTQGYNAQTAIATAAASWLAGTFAWNTATVTGSQANVVQAVSDTSATITASIVANTIGNTNVSVVRINPTLSFDGFLMSNTSSVTTLTAEFTNYTFTLVGPTTNNQIGVAPLSPSVLITASHSIPNGTITFTKTANDGITIVNTALTANLSMSSNTLTLANTTLSARLFDQYGRLVRQIDTPINLRTYVPNIQFIGANNVVAQGYAPDQIATAAITATASPGSNSFSLQAVKISGDDLTITDYSGNNVSDRVDLRISAKAGDIGTKSGLYQINGVVVFYGNTYSVGYNVQVSATLLDAQYTLTGANGSVSSFVPPASASGTATASYVVPGGTIQWSTKVNTGLLSSNTSNSTVYTATANQSVIGSNPLSLTVTGTLLDSNGFVVDTKSANVFSTATVPDPALTISGANTVTTSNVFTAVAATTLTATSAAGIPGLSYQWSYTLVSGTQPTITPSTSTIALSNTIRGLGTVGSVVDVTCKVLSNGTIIGTKVTRVTLSATCPLPTQTFTPSSASAADYNYPVVATGRVVATQPQGGYITWDYAPNAGSGPVSVSVSGANTNNSTWSGTASQSSVGVISQVWTVIAHYYTPDGVLINSQSTTSVSISSQRLDPGFYLYYPTNDAWARLSTWNENSSVTSQVRAGWGNIGGTVTCQISAAYAGGSAATPSSDSNTGYLTMTKSRTNEGLGEKSSVYNFTFTLFRNGQQIAGPLTAGVGCDIIPYYLNLSASPSTSVSASDNNATIVITASSNYPGFGGVSWRYGLTGGNGTATFAPAATQINCTQYVASYISTLSGNYNVFADYFSDGATRTTGIGIFLSAQRTYNVGSGGGTCVASEMWLDEFFQARDIMKDMTFKTWSPETGFEQTAVEKVHERVMQECVLITTQSGAELICSVTTPFNLETATDDLATGHYELAPNMLGHKVLVDNYGELIWDPVVTVEHIGKREVVPISFGGKSFPAGRSSQKRIYSHNMRKPLDG